MDSPIRDVVSASGNLIVVAGAGTGKTYKLVQTCLQKIRGGARIDEMLVVTFTKAAAAELRARIATALNAAFEADPNDAHVAQQIALLDRAQISTLHSFCLELVSRHFSELGLSARLTTLESAQAGALQSEALDALFEKYFEAKTDRAKAVRTLLLDWFRGDDAEARRLVLKICAHTQALPDPAEWFAHQRAVFSGPVPELWRDQLDISIQQWADRWRPIIEAQPEEKHPARSHILNAIGGMDLVEAARIREDENLWPRGTIGKFRKPIEKFFSEARLLASWQAANALEEDWELVRAASKEVLQIAEEFGAEFANVKRERGFVDFNDLEQFSLRLLWDGEEPSAIAAHWREKLKWIFVDEYQDINRAQDKIITALARENRFLVGDVKQSIYGFRQADPAVFQEYESSWGKGDGGAIELLLRNWRSHERILDFVNALFGGIMRREAGGVVYDDTARLQFADEPARFHLSAKHDPTPQVEVHLIDAADEDDADETNPLAEMAGAESEAAIIAQLCEKIVLEGRGSYGDVVILMRSAASEIEAFARTFSSRGIPLDARRSGFFNCIEALDLTNLLTILDNPLQDIPLLSVLRSPFGCFTLEELAQVRLALRRGPFWEAFQIFARENPLGKAAAFIEQFRGWRDLSRRSSLAQRLELILEQTGYEEWMAAQGRGTQRRANIRRLIELARQFDAIRGEGLYPFLKYIEDQSSAASDIPPAPAESRGAVRLMSVHQSKGLQFPIVIVAGLRKKFNRQDLSGLYLLDEKFGLCLKARPPGTRRQYETIAFSAARERMERRMVDEEMRILYVALTRAEKRLILVATPQKTTLNRWRNGQAPAAPNTMLDWIGPWLTADCPNWLELDSGAATHWCWQRHATFEIQLTPPSGQNQQTIAPEILASLKARIEWQYPFGAATTQEAKTSATRLRRGLADEPELGPVIAALKPIKKSRLQANELGQAAHRLLELANFESFQNEQDLRAEMVRLQFTEDEKEALNPETFLAFWRSPFGQKLLEKSAYLQRELIFTAKFSRADLQAVGAPVQQDFGPEEFIVVQGAADLAAILEKEIWLVDFKTDQLPTSLLAGRIQEYSLQLRIYALALSRIYNRPVTRMCLHFLDSNRTEWIDPYQPGYLPLM